MGVYVNAFEAIITRLKAHALPGGLLDNTTLIYGSKRDLQETADMMPSITITIDAITLDGGAIAQNKRVENFNIDLLIKYSVIDARLEDNNYYNTDLETGFLYYLENVMDCLFLDNNQALEPYLNSFNEVPIISVNNIATHTDFITCNININGKLKNNKFYERRI